VGRTELGLLTGIVVALAIAGAAAAWTAVRGATGTPELTIDIRYSHFDPSELSVPVGVPVTVVLRNRDPIDHEWILGEEAVHERHRTGTEPVHAARPTEVTVPAGESRRTTIVIDEAGSLQYICHLPGHEAYGMVGVLVASGG
jgi:uncharacterized cupredoxin-like copper-binding protein